jgi:two-component system, OmpR family, response regulator
LYRPIQSGERLVFIDFRELLEVDGSPDLSGRRSIELLARHNEEESMRILLVEDDRELGNAVAASLSGEGYAVDWLTDGVAATTALKTATYDLVVLDLGLPKQDGLSMLRELRSRSDTQRAVPVLIATAMDSVKDRVGGLDAGADDYLVKPFSLDELHARVRALIRRRNAVASNVITHGALAFDLQSHQATVDGAPLELSAREAAILEVLLMRVGRAVSKEQLMESLFTWDRDITLNAIEVYVHRLRKKLELAKVSVRTFRGLGYCIEKSGGEKVETTTP